MRWRSRPRRLLRRWRRRKGSEGNVWQAGGVQGNSLRERRVEGEVRGYANSLQRRRGNTHKIVIYGQSDPSSVTGGSGDDELLGWIQGHKSQDEGTGAVSSERAWGSSADITVCSEPKEYDTGSFRHLFGSPESFNQVARAAMNEINRTTGRTLGRVVHSQRLYHSSSSSERIPRAIVPKETTHSGTTQKSRVVDIRKNLTVRNPFVQVAAEHPGACFNGMGWNRAISNQAISPGSRHLVVEDSLVRDLNEIFLNGQTTVLSFGGASVAQVIKMMEFQGEDHLDTLVKMLGTNDVSRVPVTQRASGSPYWSVF